MKKTSPTSKLHYIGESLEFPRQRANRALSKFFLTLSFPRDEVLNHLFSYSECESSTTRREKMLEAVVMDGNALGILSSLPYFERISSVVPPV